MRRLYIVNGAAGSGKDTFVDYCTYSLRDAEIVSNVHSSDTAKKALSLLGYKGEKTPEERSLLAALTKYGQKRGESKRLIDSVSYADTVFFHERDPKEIRNLKALFPIAKTILIRRPGAKELEPDAWGIEDFDYDYVIDNEGTLEDLRAKALEFCIKEYL